MKNLTEFINEKLVVDKNFKDDIYATAAAVLCGDSKDCDMDYLIKNLKNLKNNVYLDDMDVVVGDQTVAEFFDDGTMLFPAGFPKELAIAIRDEFAYNSAEGSGNPKNNSIIIGDEDDPEWDEYAEEHK